LVRDGQKPAITGVAVVFEEAGEALDQRFLRGAIAGRVIGNRRQVRVFATHQPTDQGHQGIEMFFAMTGRARLIELHNSLFYGTIAPIRITHEMLLLTERSLAGRSIPWVMRVRF
jgi:hypothetical protein